MSNIVTKRNTVIALAISALMLGSMLPGTIRPVLATANHSNYSSNVVVVFNGQSLPSNVADIIAAAGGQINTAVPDIGVVQARPTSASGDQFIQNLKANSGVLDAGYDVMADLITPTNIVSDDSSVTPDNGPPNHPIPPPPSVIVGAPAADRYYSPANGNVPPNQWAIYRVGGFGATPYGPAGGAWDTTKGIPGVTIAIVDTGVSSLHPDVASKIIDAQSSIFGTTNLFTCTNAAVPITGPCDDGTPEDQEGHGTWTSSLAAGALDAPGGLGAVVGVAPSVTIANLKVLVRTPSGGGSGEFAWTIAAIVYAANQGYQVISMSLGGFIDQTNKADHAIFVGLTRATNYAFNKGSLLVAAAGNNGIRLDNTCNPHVSGAPSTCLRELPGTLPHVIAVTATTNPATSPGGVDGIASYSNFGHSLGGLSAPGGDLPAGGAIGTTGFVRGACGPGKQGTFSSVFSGCFTLGHVYYVRATGTSAATPLVAGAAALVFSVNPNLRSHDVSRILYQTAQDLGKPGFDEFFQFGLVDATAAVALASTRP